MELLAIRLSAIKHALSRWLWALLLTRLYEVLPLLCPQCGGEVRIIAFIHRGSGDPRDSRASGRADIAAASAAGTRAAAVGDAGRRARRERSTGATGTGLRSLIRVPFNPHHPNFCAIP